MIEALLTLLAALILAAVAGWFSIVGVMSVYAGAVTTAIVLGASIEFGKLVMISSVFRNWKKFPWILKGPMLVAIISIMMVTSMSVFGFLSKAHLEQGAATIDNGPKIERLDDQIARERTRIADDEKVISQLDATVNSFIGKDNGERALQVRRYQDSQRKQLRADINTAQKNIDELSNEKAPLAAEVRKLQLDVGPIRYIGELIYGDNNTDKNIERAVKLFSGLIVLILDPSAVMLLIAFNHIIARLENEKKEKGTQAVFVEKDRRESLTTFKQIRDKIFEAGRRRFGKTVHNEKNPDGYENISEDNKVPENKEIHSPLSSEFIEILNEKEEINTESDKGNEEYPSVQSASDINIRNDEETMEISMGISQTSKQQSAETVERLPAEIPKAQTPEHKIDYVPYLSADDIIWPEIKFYEKKETVYTDSETESGPVELVDEAGHIGQHEEGSALVAREDDRAVEIGTSMDEPLQDEGTLAKNVEEDEIDEDEKAILEMFRMAKVVPPPAIVRSPTPTVVDKSAKSEGDVEGRNERIPETLENAVSTIQVNVPPTLTSPPMPHFIPQKARNYRGNLRNLVPPPLPPKIQPIVNEPVKTDKYPKALSWLNEFERSRK